MKTKEIVDPQFAAYEAKRSLLDNRYRYISAIQDGSFGKVTLAFDTKTHTEVALKAMHRLCNETRRMANHEIKMLTRLGSNCDNICKLLHHFETANYVILVLEYCSQGDLYDLIHLAASISSVDIWHIAKELLAGIKYAHSVGVFHRDIKPENVLFNSYGTVKLCDWGLLTSSKVSLNFNVGTEKYLAPECFKREDSSVDYNAKYADYWSLGITLLTAVFGTSPFKPIGDKSLEMDTNFKNFAMYGKSEVLYDIYPTMNGNCFKIFMNLLKVGSIDDDIEDKQKKITSRSLDAFLDDLEANWRFGLTIDEEYELEELEAYTTDSHNAISKNTDLFAMDHDLDQNSDSLTSATRYDDSIYELDVEYEEERKLQRSISLSQSKNSNRRSGTNIDESSFEKLMMIMIPEQNANNKSKEFGSLIPSLVALSAGKSWCDLDDEDHLAVMIEEMKNHSLNTINEESPSRNKVQDLGVRISGNDIGNELHAY